ncbi:MAG: ATP-grasp domain-containing protein [Candidatus Thiodiazotropha sp.]
MSADNATLLILANSGRALAESARRGGYRVTVLDGYCDQDTLAAADCWPVTQGFGNLEVEMFVEEMAALFPAKPEGVIYGAGLEESTPLLRRLSADFKLFGNDPSVLELLRRPRRYFSLLDRLEIPYPQVSFIPPYSAGAKRWLIKRAGSCGGQGVAYFDAAHSAADATCYYQRHMPGQAMSILFIADGGRHRTIGYNRLGMGASSRPAPFLYSGATGQASLSPAHRAKIELIVSRLVSELKLRGINSLDFVVADDGPFVIDLNPRPAATLELYEHMTGEGWIKHHIAACLGELPSLPLVGSAVIHGQQIVYSPRSFEMPREPAWQPWVKDRPLAGSRVVEGQPLCSLYAEGSSVEEVEIVLRQRQDEILRMLGVSLYQPHARKVAV